MIKNIIKQITSSKIIGEVVRKSGSIAFNVCVTAIGTFIGRTLFKLTEELLERGSVQSPPTPQQEQTKRGESKKKEKKEKVVKEKISKTTKQQRNKI